MGIPMYMRIQQYIKAQINSGAWKENSVIPTENDLSKQFGCSRITVTNALRGLVKDGVIYRIQGKGTYVSEQKNAASLYEKGNLTQMALSLESLSIPGEHKCVNFRIEAPSEKIQGIFHLSEEQKIIAFDRIKYVDGEVFAVEQVFLPHFLYASGIHNFSEKKWLNQSILEIEEACGITVGKGIVSSCPILCPDTASKFLGVPEGTPVLQFSVEIRDVQEHLVAYEIIYTKGHQERVFVP